MKLNETMNLNLLSMLKMTTTFEGHKSFVVTFRRYQLNANTHDIAKRINIYIAKASTVEIVAAKQLRLASVGC